MTPGTLILAGLAIYLIARSGSPQGAPAREHEATPLPAEALPPAIPSSPSEPAPDGYMWNWTPYDGWHLRPL